MQDTSFVVSPIPDHAFFQHSVFDREIGNRLFEGDRLGTQLLYLRARRLTRRVTGQALLARLEELLRSTVIQARRDTLAPAKLGNALFAPQALEHDADLLLGRVLLAGTPADVLHDLLSRRLLCSVFLSHLHSLAVTMSQKPSVTNQIRYPMGADVGQYLTPAPTGQI